MITYWIFVIVDFVTNTVDILRILAMTCLGTTSVKNKSVTQLGRSVVFSEPVSSDEMFLKVVYY